MLSPIERKKKIVGEKAAEYVTDGMKVGLGSGSTVYWTIRKIGELVQQGMQIKGIPSSRRTEKWAEQFGVPLTSFSEVQTLDVAIDGADEIDQQKNLIKGGGGSLFREKMVDSTSRQLIIIADDSKMVSHLGQYPLPVEVIPFGWEMTAQKIAQLDCVPQLRMYKGKIFITDNGNYILDCPFGAILHPKELHQQLKCICGVVETGLFIDMTHIVLIGKKDGVNVLL